MTEIPQPYAKQLEGHLDVLVEALPTATPEQARELISLLLELTFGYGLIKGKASVVTEFVKGTNGRNL